MSWLNRIAAKTPKLKQLQRTQYEIFGNDSLPNSHLGELAENQSGTVGVKTIGLAHGLTDNMMSPGNFAGTLQINTSQVNNGLPLKLNFDVTKGLYTPDKFTTQAPEANLSTAINNGLPVSTLNKQYSDFVTKTLADFNKRYDWDLSDATLLAKKARYSNMNKGGVREWLRGYGINPYSLSGSQRKQLRLLFESGDIHKFETDLATIGGDKLRGDDFKNILISRLGGSNDIFTGALQKFNATALLNYNPQTTEQKELTPEEDLMNYIKDSLSGYGLDANGKTYSDLRITDFQNWYNGLNYGDKPLTVDGKFGNATMSALRTVARNFNKTNPNEWIESLFGKQLFGLNKPHLQARTIKRTGSGLSSSGATLVPVSIRRPETETLKMLTSDWNGKMNYTYTGPRYKWVASDAQIKEWKRLGYSDKQILEMKYNTRYKVD